MADEILVNVNNTIDNVVLNNIVNQEVVTLSVSDNSDQVQIIASPNLYQVNVIKGLSAYQVVTSVNGSVGDISITKYTISLGNVDNTSDLNKPISTATQTALDLKANSTDVNSALSLKANSSDVTASLLTKANTTDVNAYLALKANTSEVALKANIASPTFTGTVSGITKSMVGLSNVDNTSDASKPISSATQTALDAKQNSLTAGTGLSIVGSTITNTAPDQTVSITAGTGITKSGTYPNFTIASSITQFTAADARGSISLTTNGTSGAASYNSTTGVLNIPNYASSGGSGTVTSVALSAPTGFSVSGSPVTDLGTLALSFAAGYSLPSDITQATWTAKQNALSGTGFVKISGTTISYDNSTYLTSNQTITLSGDISGSGTTAITGTLATITQAATGSFVKITLDTKGRVTGNTAVGSSDITTALGYTPYNATNPNGYTSNTGTVTSVAALTLGTSGTDLGSTVATGTTTPVITLNVPTASSTNRGALSSADWTTFNNKQSTITLTTTGSSGSSTFTANTLNVPTYTLAGLGGQTSSTNLTSLSGLTFSSTSFVKMSAAGTFALDTTAYTANTGTVTSVGGTGTVNGLTLTGTVTTSGNLTLGGTLDLSSPPAIGGTTASTGRFTTITSTATTGTAPFTVASTTNVANLNASSLNGATFASPGTIGGTTASAATFTTLQATDFFLQQSTPSAINATATLTIAQLLTEIITTTSTTAVTFTLPTGTLTDAGILAGALPVNGAFDWIIINLGSSTGAITVQGGTNNTLVGSGAIAISTSGRFRTRKTATNTFSTYRI